MMAPCDAVLLRVFIGKDDRTREHRPLCEVIVGAQRLPGGRSRSFAGRWASLAFRVRLAEELPQVIEIVDGEEKIKALLPTLNE